MIITRTFSQAWVNGEDTIVALATAQGRSAVALVRLSGNRAVEIAGRHINPWPIDPRETRLCTVYGHERLLDRALVTIYPGPRSFTGEDVVEISTHGGLVVPVSVIAALISSGAREALPGEFTRRAVLNGKLDIIQAEAIGDLVDARSTAMQQAALSQLDGGLSSRIASLREGVLSLESLIAYDVDFPEEDDGPISRDRILRVTDDLVEVLNHLLATIPIGEIVREGAIVVIAGEPNAGKSSLFNALLGEQRAIVTEIPGTTRDSIEGLINAGQWPLRLVDTAGLRQSGDIIERLGIETSERYIARAHLILNCGETTESLEKTRSVVSSMSVAPMIGVLTKADLSMESATTPGLAAVSEIRVSARTGEGLSRLNAEVTSVLTQTYGDLTAEAPLLTRVRHIQAIECAKAEIEEFKTAWASRSVPVTIAAVHLRSAAIVLEGLIGAVSTEDVLERLFSSFCVGK